MKLQMKIKATFIAVALLMALGGEASAVQQLVLKAAIPAPGTEMPEAYALTWSALALLASKKNISTGIGILSTRQEVRAALETGQVDIAFLPAADITRSRYFGDELVWAPGWIALVSPVVSRERMRLALGFISLAASFTEPPLVRPTDPEDDTPLRKLTDDNRLLETVAEDIALLLSAGNIRAAFFHSMQESTARGKRVGVRQFLQETRHLESALRVVHDRLQLAIQRVVPLVLYFPVEADRKAWQGGPELLVAFDDGFVELSRYQSINAIDTKGKRRLLQLSAATSAKQGQPSFVGISVAQPPVLAIERCDPPGPNSVAVRADRDFDDDDAHRPSRRDDDLHQLDATEGCLLPQPRDSLQVPRVPPNTVINTQFQLLKDHDPWFRGADDLTLFLFLPGRTLHIDYGERRTKDGVVTTNRALYECPSDRARQLAGFVWLDEDWIVPDRVGEILIDCGALSGKMVFTAGDITFSLVKTGRARRDD